MSIFFYVLYFFIAILTAIFLALLEIQIEGKDGWAGKLPTWRKKIKFSKYIPGADKDITGYHLYNWLFRFSLLHVAFLFNPWNIGKELLLLSFYFLSSRLEDFFWFVLNPYYGIKKFKKKFIPWHTQWLGPFPIQYYWSLIVWAIFFWLGLKLL